jgi:ATP-dependent Clp protease protease subunit
MIWTSKISPLLKEVELRKPPAIVKVNKFTEESAKKFHQEMAMAHNSGQKVIPIVIDSYGGQVYSLHVNDLSHSSRRPSRCYNR